MPFGFASQYGVLLERGNPPCIVHQALPPLSVLAELRRHLGEPFILQSVAESEFSRRLSQSYQRGNNEAVQCLDYRVFYFQ